MDDRTIDVLATFRKMVSQDVAAYCEKPGASWEHIQGMLFGPLTLFAILFGLSLVLRAAARLKAAPNG